MAASNTSVKPQDRSIARRLVTVVLSDFFCWFPIGLMGLLASHEVPLPGEVNVATAIFVLPAILSPLSQDGLSDHNDSSSSSSDSDDESDREEEENGKDDNPAPRVLTLHDSILRALDPERLGDSYGLQMEKQKASKVEDCASKSGGQTPEAIVIHTGINNLKTETAEKASEKFVSVVQDLASKHPDAKIVVSKLDRATEPTDKTCRLRENCTTRWPNDVQYAAKTSVLEGLKFVADGLRDLPGFSSIE
nr:hypothetical protein BaRGS_024741 [Batillaria attramentaria]